MKKKLLIGIVIFVAIISIAVFCYVKFVSNSNDDKTSETVSQASDDNSSDKDLAEQLNNQLNLGSWFTFISSEKDKYDLINLHYNYGKSTHVTIKLKDTDVKSFSISTDILSYSWVNVEETIECVRLLATNNSLFNFSREDTEKIAKTIIDNALNDKNTSITVNNIFITAAVTLKDYVIIEFGINEI